MYQIINKTKNSIVNASGDWPIEQLEDMLNHGDKIIVISTYSNTIKVPRVDHEDNEWYWDSYPFNPESL